MVKAHLKTGSLLEKPKSINVFRDGAWLEQQMGYVYLQGEWVPFIEYLKWIYEPGVEHYELDTWGDGNLIMDDDYFLFTQSLNIFRVFTKEKINFNGYKTLYFDCDVEVPHVSNIVRVGVSTKQSAGSYGGNFVSYFERSFPSGGREVVELDVSDITGDYYILIDSEMAPSTARNSGYFYSIWLE